MPVIIKDYNTIVNELVVQLATELSGTITDYNPGSVMRTFAEAVAYQLGKNSNIPDNVFQQIENAYNAAFISTSTGDDLDKLVELVGVTRTPAVKSSGEVTFYANPVPGSDITIPAGTQVSTQPNDSGIRTIFVTKTDATLLAGNPSVLVLIEAQTAGISGNVAANKVTFLVTPIFGITSINNANLVSGGADKETDSHLRERAKGAVEVSGNATSEALRLAVLGVAGVGSVTVHDLPERSMTAEVHTYNTGTNNYQLYVWNVIDDTNVVVTGTVSSAPYTFINGTDYNVDEYTNEIQFGIGGTDPDNGTTFLADYNYNHLGEVDMIVAGISIPMSPTTLAEVEDVIDERKAAGVKVTVIEPAVINVDVTCFIYAKNGYTAVDVASAVQTALENHLNSMQVDYDVYRADLFEVIQAVDGVLNSTISLPAADVSITDVEVARAGTITVNY